MRGVEVKHVRHEDVDLQKVWDVESATRKDVRYVGHSKNETSKRRFPLNDAARDAITRMLKRADELAPTAPEHYLWCASKHHHYDPTKPAKKWDGAWRSLPDAACPASGSTTYATRSSRTCSRPVSPSTLSRP
jgi:hypothetical protein